MVSMTKLTKNMETQIHGNIVPMSSITFLLEQLLMEIFFVFMEDYHHKLKPLIKFEPLIERWKFLMKVHFQI